MATMKWSERYIEEWRATRDGVSEALAMMIGQYLFGAVPMTQEEYHQLKSELRSDLETVRKHISADRITTSARTWESDEVEAMFVSLHCLAIICWDKLYNKYDPELEEDVVHDCMSAGEAAVHELVKYGLLAPLREGGKWTAAGIDMLNGKLR